MPTATKLLLLADNPGREYVARIQTGASRHASRTSFALAMENVFERVLSELTSMVEGCCQRILRS